MRKKHETRIVANCQSFLERNVALPTLLEAFGLLRGNEAWRRTTGGKYSQLYKKDFGPGNLHLISDSNIFQIQMMKPYVPEPFPGAMMHGKKTPTAHWTTKDKPQSAEVKKETKAILNNIMEAVVGKKRAQDKFYSTINPIKFVGDNGATEKKTNLKMIKMPSLGCKKQRNCKK